MDGARIMSIAMSRDDYCKLSEEMTMYLEGVWSNTDGRHICEAKKNSSSSSLFNDEPAPYGLFIVR